MPSTLTWVDHDPAARERSLRILALFQEKETRDELGLGGIRDAFADQLFPGTSTIQTRLRYMLLVPWLYRRLEAKQIPAAEFAARARKEELALVAPILDSDDRAGLFGRTAGKSLKRLPSSVYWAGLGAWGIRHFRGSQDEYHRGVDSLYRRRSLPSRREDGETEPDEAALTWHPKLPDPPAGFPEKVGFTLTPAEASFLLDRIVSTQGGSLLAHLALHCRPADVDYPWEHPDQATFSPAQRELLEHARRFSEVMHGAAILYNLQLAEIEDREEIVSGRRADLQEWTADLDEDDLRGWSLPRLWELTLDRGHAITRSTRHFVEDWVELVRDTRSPLADETAARELVEHRERRLKKARSRFANERARDQWTGKAGMGRLSFRWPTVRSFHEDLAAGLGGR